MTLIKSIKEIAISRAEECTKIVGDRYLTSIVPVYGVSKRATPDLIGTGFLLSVQGAPFFVTAAHVIDHNEVTSLYFGNGSNLAMIEGDFRATNLPKNGRDDDHYDFAYWKLTDAMLDELGSPQFFMETDISKNRGTLNRRQFLVMGYPISINEKPNVPELKVQAQLWTYQGMHVENAKLARKLKVTGNDHFFIKYQKRSKNYNGNIVNSISPIGVSGGVLIDLGLPSLGNLAADAACTGLLAGLAIEHHADHKSMVFVRIELIVEKIKQDMLEQLV